ncbi:uncharacterized protein BDV17DRAFT_295240 [Aspergillus undulatus]|uniref:uncharacterized protein n=1 Tax=Aspergillus undulatus TaxID=1810928 RepID=UPI003CCDDF50
MINFRWRSNDEPNSDEKPGLLSQLSLASRWSDLSQSQTSIAENDEPRSLHGRDWIKGVVVCSWIMGTVLSLNIILTVIAAGIAYSKNNETDFPFASLHTGSCSVTKKWTTGLHLVINVLSTAMLGTSNYCMQCLASPSRAEVDDAHSKRLWLRIGIPNIWHLLRRQRGRRQSLGWLLMVTSFPIHLIYNSALFFALGPTKYTDIVAPAGPMRGNTSADFEECFEDNIGLDLAAINASMSRSDLQTLSKQDCINTFAQDYVSAQRLVVLVTNDPMPDGEPLAFMGPGNDPIGSGSGSGSPFDWLCDGDHDCTKDMVNATSLSWEVRPYKFSTPSIRLSIQTQSRTSNQSGHIYFNPGSELDRPDVRRLNEILSAHPRPYEDKVQDELDDPSNWVDPSSSQNVTIRGHNPMCRPQLNSQSERQEQTYSVDHCLTVPIDETCQLFFSPPICLVVIACNLVKLICSLLTAKDYREDIFLTIGDAIASFLGRPDPTTESSCLLPKALVERGSQGWRKKQKKKRGKTRIMIFLHQGIHKSSPCHSDDGQSDGSRPFVCMLIPAIYLLRLGILDYNQGYGVKTIWDSGLGEVTGSTLLDGIPVPRGDQSILPMILLANTPQVFVSFAYFVLNTLLTIMLGAVEYDNYARVKKPLRVSWPRRAQRSTYYLSLPYRYSFPLLSVSAILHWLVSQSLFFVQIIPFDMNGKEDPGEEITTVGHSPVAIIFAIIVGGLLPVVSMLLGLRRFKSSMPLVAQCSAAISAACHPATSNSSDDADHALMPVQWGEIPGVYESPDPWTFPNRLGGNTASAHESDQRPASLSSLSDLDAVESGFYHSSFTSGEVYEPTKGRLYI